MARSQVIEKPANPGKARDALPAGAEDRIAIGALISAATLLTVGLLWDMSWDISFGRDSFWSPPHLAVNAGGALAAAVSFWWALRATLRGDAATVGFGPLRMPLGVAFVLWGGVAMLAAGVSDLAWSTAYGMAFGAWTPPQVLFVLAVTAILVGVLLAAGARSEGGLAVACAGGLLLTFAAVATAPYSLPNLQHGARFFLLSSAIYPFLLAWIARGGTPRYAATVSAAIYLALVGVMVWVLPLFEARALVGPVFQRIDHMVPPRFPLLLIVPALIVDRVAGGGGRPATRGRATRSDAARAVILGVALTTAFVAVQWSFSAFLLSPASDNRFWAGGGRHWPFYADIGEERRQFWEPEGKLDLLSAAACVMVASLGARAGLWLGRWTRALRR